MATAFIFVSLVTGDFQPHRFLFGVPFSLAIFAALTAVSLLTGGNLMRMAAGVIPDDFSRRAWWSLSGMMVLRCLFGDLGDAGNSFVADNTVSVLICASAAVFLLTDCYQQSVDWPKFDVPELGTFPSPRRKTTAIHVASPGWNVFRIVSCLLALVAILQLARGLQICLGDRTVFDDFFISELGVGEHAQTFTNTLLLFGVLMLPFFLSFVFEHDGGIPAESVRIAIGGSLAVGGIVGIGVWDLRSPLHYLSIAIWLWPLAVVVDHQVPTPRGFVNVRLPTWIVKGSMAMYVISMIVLGVSNTGRPLCIIAQRLVVASTLAWLLWLVKTMTAESFGWGERVNGSAE